MDSPNVHAPRFIGIDMAAGPDASAAMIAVAVEGLLHPRRTIDVALEGIAERARQDRRWGESNHPSIPTGVKFPCAFFGIPSADAARSHCEDAFRRGTGSNAHILLEEVSEAIEAAHDPVALRAELVQVQAVCIKWIENIDRLADKEKNHG